MPQSDVYWTLHTADETIPVESVLNEPEEINRLTKGDTATFVLRLYDDLTVTSLQNKTIQSGESEIYESVNVAENGTLNVEENGSINATETQQRLEPYAKEAGAFARQQTLDNTQRYREHIATDTISSIVIGLEPSPLLKDKQIEGVWGLLASAVDTRVPALSNNEFTIEVEILAPFSDFGSYSDVQTTLEM